MSKTLAYCLALGLAVTSVACSTQESATKQDREPLTQPDGSDEDSDADKDTAGMAIDAAVKRAVEDLEAGEFAVLYAQAGVYHPVEDNEVVLQPQPFEVHVVAPPEFGVMINFSRNRASFDRALEGQELPGPVGAPGTGMAERPFNESQQIMLNTTGSHYWIYQSSEQHRFDEVRKVGGPRELVVGKRSIKQLYDVDEKAEIPLGEMAGETIYAVEFKHIDKMAKRPPKRAYTIRFRQD